MIKVYFGNNESKKYIGESNTDSGAYCDSARCCFPYETQCLGRAPAQKEKAHLRKLFLSMNSLLILYHIQGVAR